MEDYQSQDPVTPFLKELYVKFDFEAAQRELTLALQIVGKDFFLNEFRDEFLDNARYLINEAYCMIHQEIASGVSPTFFWCPCLTLLAPSHLFERLNISRDEGEKWIVNLIRETRMGTDAKIDLEKVTEIRVLLLSSFFC